MQPTKWFLPTLGWHEVRVLHKAFYLYPSLGIVFSLWINTFKVFSMSDSGGGLPWVKIAALWYRDP